MKSWKDNFDDWNSRPMKISLKFNGNFEKFVASAKLFGNVFSPVTVQFPPSITFLSP